LLNAATRTETRRNATDYAHMLNKLSTKADTAAMVMENVEKAVPHRVCHMQSGGKPPAQPGGQLCVPINGCFDTQRHEPRMTLNVCQSFEI